MHPITQRKIRFYEKEQNEVTVMLEIDHYSYYIESLCNTPINRLKAIKNKALTKLSQQSISMV